MKNKSGGKQPKKSAGGKADPPKKSGGFKSKKAQSSKAQSGRLAKALPQGGRQAKAVRPAPKKGKKRDAGAPSGILKKYRAPLLSGALLGASFIPFPAAGQQFFALIPLWLFIFRQKNLKPILIGAWICQFVMSLIGFNWLIYTAHFFGQMSWPLSFLILMGFCSFANIYLVLAGALWFFLAKKIPAKILGRPAPAAYQLLLLPLIFSLLHQIAPALFPWSMGAPWLWGGLPGAQTAELWGFRFLGALFYVFNFLLLLAVLGGWRRRAGLAALAAAAGLFALLNGLGVYLKRRLPEPDRQINILVIQPNIGSVQHLSKKPLFSGPADTPPEKNKPKRKGEKSRQGLSARWSAYMERLKRLAGLSGFRHASARKARSLFPNNPRGQSLFITKELTYKHFLKAAKKLKIKNLKEAHKGIHLILWPEGAYPYPISKTADRTPGLSRFVRQIGAPLATGAIGRGPKGYSNSLFVFDREGKLLKPVYSKSRLLAFGEYFPGSKRFPFLLKWFPYFGASLVPGDGPSALNLNGRSLGFQICYESLFDKFTRDLAQKEPHVLINITNDSWYGGWQEPWQHLVLSLARGIEIRRPLIRATNTGISAAIGADGEVGGRSPINRAWGHLYKIPYYEKPLRTLFMGWGFYITEIFLALWALLLCLPALFARRERKPPPPSA